MFHVEPSNKGGDSVADVTLSVNNTRQLNRETFSRGG